MSNINLDQINQKFVNATPKEILLWAWEIFEGQIALSSSFQTQSVPLLHIISQCIPQAPVLFLDTGFHFPETLIFRDELTKQWSLNTQVIKPSLGHDSFKKKYGEIFRQNPDLCCYLNKVEPLEGALKNYRAWVSGIRGDQTQARQNTPIISEPEKGKYKVAPLVKWTDRDIWAYINSHQLPEHPLLSQGYLSIGCAPCTSPVFGSADPRAGRWPGLNKTECGLHISSKIVRSNL